MGNEAEYQRTDEDVLKELPFKLAPRVTKAGACVRACVGICLYVCVRPLCLRACVCVYRALIRVKATRTSICLWLVKALTCAARQTLHGRQPACLL
jgi:hypothetical protein